MCGETSVPSIAVAAIPSVFGWCQIGPAVAPSLHRLAEKRTRHQHLLLNSYLSDMRRLDFGKPTDGMKAYGQPTALSHLGSPTGEQPKQTA